MSGVEGQVRAFSFRKAGIWNRLKTLGVFDVLFIIVLLISLWSRISRFDYPLSNHETSRDYLVSHHIVKYGEWPLVGPHNGALNLPVNSPVYFYALAGLLEISDNIMFLEAVNIFLQLLSIAAVYFLGRLIFSAQTGVVAASLFASSYLVMAESSSLWQPFVMLTFVNLAFVFLALSYKMRSYFFCFLAGFFLVFSASLHISAFTIFPAFLMIEFLILRDQKQKMLNILNVYIFQLVWLLLFFAPTVYFNLVYPNMNSGSFGKFDLNPSAIFVSFASISVRFAGIKPAFLFFGVLASVYLYFLKRKKDSRQKFFLGLMILGIIQVLLLTLFSGFTIQDYYFSPIFGIWAIVISELIAGSFQNGYWLLPLKFILIILLIKAFSWNFALFKEHRVLSGSTQIEDITKVIADKAADSNFQFAVTENGDKHPTDAIFWVPLEDRLSKKFTTVNNVGNSYAVDNSSDYIFLVCKSYTSIAEVNGQCLDPFLAKESSLYTFVDIIYDRYPFSILLLKKS